MKKFKWYLLFPLVLVVVILISGSCFNITVPQREGQQPTGGGQSTPPVINVFSAAPANITAGSSATLSWQVTGASTVNISPGIGNVAMSGSTSVTPGAGTSYMLTATNGSASVTAVAQVSVEAASPAPSSATLPVIDSFDANPDSILIGGASTLSWAVSNVISVTISPAIGAVAPTGNKSVSPGTTTTYTLTATNNAGWRSKSITVTASTIKIFKPIVTLVALAQFEDKTWVLEKYGTTNNLQDTIPGKEVNARFDSATDKVNGSAGCNSYSANYQRTFNNVAVSGMSSTMMLCMPNTVMQQESAFKNALSGAQSCKIVSNKLEINCTLDRILIFHPK
jgi:heat shock protein HslJ